MKKFRMVAALAIATMTLGACGADNEGTAGEFGALSVMIKGIESIPEGVEKVELTVTQVGGTFEATSELTSAPWSFVFTNLEFGLYNVSAVAFDADDVVIFENTGTEVEVKAGGDPVVQIYLVQKDQSSEVTMPQFVTVTLDKNAVLLNETLDIAVTATGGIGALSLHGRFWSGACAPEDRTTDSWGNWECVNAPAATFGSFSAADGLNLTWTAPSILPPVNPDTNDTDIWFVLVLEDEAQNISELGITVPVRPNYLPSTEFEMAFHMAPTVSYRSRVLNDGDAGRIYVRLTPTSDGGVPMDYELTTTCPYTKVSGASETGTTNSGQHVTFTLDVLDEDRGACDLTFSVEDTAGLKTTQTLKLYTAEISPSILP